MKIIDCFIFYNELDLLNYRLTILNKYVDYFVLVESTHTFTGLPKKLFYNENKDLYKEFNEKIIHIVVENMPYKVPYIDINKNEQWINEAHQRNYMKCGIDIIKDKLNDNDIILSSDVDEIPNPKILEEFKNNTFKLYISKEATIKYSIENNANPDNSPLKFDNSELYQLELDMYYCNLRSRRKYWHGLKLLTYLAYKSLNLTFQKMRDMYKISPIIKNAGWHLSYFGDVDFIINKFKSFSDKEYNNEYHLNKERLQTNINNHINILNFEKLDVIPIEVNTNLPPQYDIYLKKYI
jgi:beta-1,4-mannosyl-glycoprotein beta-1,4-N-acetylglucosaminyltransferase